jgi:phospholipase C
MAEAVVGFALERVVGADPLGKPGRGVSQGRVREPSTLRVINRPGRQSRGTRNRRANGRDGLVFVISLDNYFGALAYAPGSPYHNGNGPCPASDHLCVDGLTCTTDSSGNLTCSNSNLDDNGSTVTAFREPSRCVRPDLDHSWLGTHHEANFLNPNQTLKYFLSDGFVRVNDLTEQVDNGSESPTDDQTIGYYNQNDLPFYYDLAQKFAISDRHFASVLGPTFSQSLLLNGRYLVWPSYDG